MSSPTALEFLLVSNNYHTLTAVTEALKQFGTSFAFVPTADAARDYVGRRKVDGIFVDLELPGTFELIQFIRAGSSNRCAVIFACMLGPSQSPIASVPGANFLLPHPLATADVVFQVTIARDTMARERRRYFRHTVSMPVLLKVAGEEFHVRMTDLGEGGMAIHAMKPIAASVAVDFILELPLGQSINGKGVVAWTNSEGMAGIRFQFFRGKSEEELQNWLAQRQLIAPAPVATT